MVVQCYHNNMFVPLLKHRHNNMSRGMDLCQRWIGLDRCIHPFKIQSVYPLVMSKYLLKMAIYSGFTH